MKFYLQYNKESVTILRGIFTYVHEHNEDNKVICILLLNRKIRKERKICRLE